MRLVEAYFPSVKHVLQMEAKALLEGNVSSGGVQWKPVDLCRDLAYMVFARHADSSNGLFCGTFANQGPDSSPGPLVWGEHDTRSASSARQAMHRSLMRQPPHKLSGSLYWSAALPMRSIRSAKPHRRQKRFFSVLRRTDSGVRVPARARRGADNGGQNRERAAQVQGHSTGDSCEQVLVPAALVSAAWFGS